MVSRRSKANGVGAKKEGEGTAGIVGRFTQAFFFFFFFGRRYMNTQPLGDRKAIAFAGKKEALYTLKGKMRCGKQAVETGLHGE